MVTWKDAEQALLGAVEYLAAMPGERWSTWYGSSWPTVLRIEQSDYPDGISRRVKVGRKEVALVERMLLAEDAPVRALDEVSRPLVATRLSAKLWPAAFGGSDWASVRVALSARRYGRLFGHGRVPGEDALRMRYSRAVTCVAKAMTRGNPAGVGALDSRPAPCPRFLCV